jgi:hypothetical protein
MNRNLVGTTMEGPSKEKNFKKSTNHKEELPVAAMFVNGSGRNAIVTTQPFSLPCK